MTKDEALKVVEEHTISREGHTPDFDAKKTLSDLQFDSLDRIELVMAFEEECGIDILDDDADQYFGDASTANEVADYIVKRTS